jgi:hypothetical protein
MRGGAVSADATAADCQRVLRRCVALFGYDLAPGVTMDRPMQESTQYERQAWCNPTDQPGSN